jgi:23S rRNA (adenine2503-C2)-methyltransferase
MRALAEEGLSVNLTVSLHEPFDSERQEIMPVAKAYTVQELLSACSYYFEKTGRRYIFEYTLIKGRNDSARHASELVRLLRGRPCLVNVIRLNEVKESGLSATTERDARAFITLLEQGGLTATLRRSVGSDIEGACGQLRRKYMETPQTLN